MRICIGIMAAIVWSTIATLRAEPAPSPIPTAWELTLQPATPTRIQVDGRTYWYLLYTVINNTGQDVDFHPEIVRVNEIESELTAEQAAARPDQAPNVSVDPAIVGVPTRVYQAIADRYARTHPFLVTPVKAISRLLQGKDNAITSVAVFPDLSPRVSKFTIYFGGLSGEKIAKANPVYSSRQPAADAGKAASDDESNPKLFVLRKTLAMPYTVPGDANTRRTAAPVLGRMTWVMR
ncbi:MAG TPA: hypothetical protein VJZ71_12340 [Phycisphaerae bacterium]|nr:hypothetical protein [Phycisphaerae bacterium]